MFAVEEWIVLQATTQTTSNQHRGYIYLTHSRVRSDYVVNVGPQISQACRRVWLHLLNKETIQANINSVDQMANRASTRPAHSPRRARRSDWLFQSCRSECWAPEGPGRPTCCWVWWSSPGQFASGCCTAASWPASPRSLSAALSGCRCPCSVTDIR